MDNKANASQPIMDDQISHQPLYRVRTEPGQRRLVADEGTKRLAADIPASMYRRVKERTADHGMTVREYIMELLARDGL